jgi:sugar porter (SP) family MFS transporter
MMRNRRADAARESAKVQPAYNAEARLAAIEEALRQDATRRSWREVFQRQWRKPLLVGIGLAVFQQITGINAIIYYANQIFAAAGFETEAARTTVTTWAIGGVNVLATVIAIAFIDRIGRRKLLLAGLVGMGVSLAVVGTAFRSIGAAHAGAAGPSTAGIVTVVALVAFIICFAFSLGPVTWTVINEIFPAHIRGRGVALATAVNWGSAFVVSQGFLSLVDAVGSSAAFFVFTGFCVLGWVWIYYYVPETKGQTLEEIQAGWGS